MHALISIMIAVKKLPQNTREDGLICSSYLINNSENSFDSHLNDSIDRVNILRGAHQYHNVVNGIIKRQDII